MCEFDAVVQESDKELINVSEGKTHDKEGNNDYYNVEISRKKDKVYKRETAASIIVVFTFLKAQPHIFL